MTQSQQFSHFFLDIPPDDLICPICHDIMNNPVQCFEGHGYCKICIEKWLDQHSTCPISCNPLDSSQLTPIRIVKNLIDNLIVKCPKNCLWKGKLFTEELHLLECELVLICCENNDCNMTFERRFLLEHQNICEYTLSLCPHVNCGQYHQRRLIDTCPYRVVECPMNCGLCFPFNQIDDHLSSSCPNEIIVCPNSPSCTSDCQERYRSVDLVVHQNTLGYLKARLDLKEARITSLELSMSDQQNSISDLQKSRVEQQNTIEELLGSLSQQNDAILRLEAKMSELIEVGQMRERLTAREIRENSVPRAKKEVRGRYHPGKYGEYRRSTGEGGIWHCCADCSRSAQGCFEGEPSHHPGFLYNTEGNYINKGSWSCCGTPYRHHQAGCQPGHHPNPFY